MKHQGSCHCGRVAFEVEGEITAGLSCNCSICQRRGSVLWFVPRAQVRMKTPESDLQTYTFNKHRIQHHFCGVCGCAPFSEALAPATGEMGAAVNLRCVDDVDFASLTIKHFDGRSL